MYKNEKGSLCPEVAQRLTGTEGGDLSTCNYVSSTPVHGKLVSLGELGREVGSGQ